MTGTKIEKTRREFIMIWEIVTKLISEPIPAKSAYALQRNATQIYTVIREVAKKREELIRKHGTYDEETKTTTVKKENDAFYAELDEFLNTTTAIEIWEIEASTIVNSLTVLVSAAELNIIDFMLCEDKLIVTTNLIH
jgi:hypothetical protein